MAEREKWASRIRFGFLTLINAVHVHMDFKSPSMRRKQEFGRTSLPCTKRVFSTELAGPYTWAESASSC
jgi:hypothetical protein